VRGGGGGGGGGEILLWTSPHTNYPVVLTTCCPISVPSGRCRHEVKWLEREAYVILECFKLLKCKPASNWHCVSCGCTLQIKRNIPKVRREWVYLLFTECARNGEVGVIVPNMYWECVMVKWEWVYLTLTWEWLYSLLKWEWIYLLFKWE